MNTEPNCVTTVHGFITYAFSIWTVATWVILLVLAWCVVQTRRQTARVSDKIDNCMCRLDAYFGAPTELDAETRLTIDMEVRRLRGETDDGAATVPSP